MGKKQLWFMILWLLFGYSGLPVQVHIVHAAPPLASQYDAYPPFLFNNPPPLVMLVMGRDHKLYYEAYNDASDLNEDGELDIVYKPNEIDYYGYFDSYKYYQYNSSSQRFNPVGTTTDKKAPAGDYWSGDFLNYQTMSRMDAIRKVLYGGYRSTDTATETVLERAYIPHDAHSWGKEYQSIENDGYDIRDYTPLDLPQSGTRHLFANTTLSDNGNPLFRVLNDSIFRIWEWVSIERPVADDRCLDGSSGPNCAAPDGIRWEAVPQSTTLGISDATHTTYSLPTNATYPGDHRAYNTLVSAYAKASRYQGEIQVSTIDGSGNPSGSNYYFLSLFNGTLNIPEGGTYTFSVDGDDAVELLVDINNDGDFADSGEVIAGFYGGHGECDCNTYSGSVSLSAGSYSFQFRHEQLTEGNGYHMRWRRTVPSSSMTDYIVRVKVADSAMPETNCKKYPAGNFKPTGLLQRHGETNGMYFGLMTGSYTKNTSGGVLRKNIGSITDEINTDTGQLTSVNGIIKTIDTLRVVDFSYTDYAHNSNCGWITTRPINEGECRMWGNPIGEMMYESMRYFAGEDPTRDFQYTGSYDNAAGTELALPKPEWVNPYTGYAYCSKPFILTISDIYPSFDSDQLPGSAFGGMAASSLGAAGPLDVSDISDMIFQEEEIKGDRFIGQLGTQYDGACTAKDVEGFGDIRGLCPEEPTKQGSYYSAAVAHYGRTEDINDVQGDQNVSTYAVALASPLPTIEIHLKNKTVRLVPFAKSVGGFDISATKGSFQPTNTIVDFYVTEIAPHYGRFRINFEDVEQGADHDMDAIIIYEYQLLDADDNPVSEATIDQAEKVKITLISEYAAGSIMQHCGYIISGTTSDGTYLEVRDKDTDASSDPNYFLDTPNITGALPLTNTRIFTVSSSGASAASLLKNPLWYAAKWGGFKEKEENANNLPDEESEWDKDGDGVPDTYFYVVNPLKLEKQLSKSFADISNQTSSGTAAAVVANSGEGEGSMIQAFFEPEHFSPANETLTWLGHLKSLWVDAFGHIREDTNHDYKLNFASDRILEYGTDSEGNGYIRRYTEHYHYDENNQNNEDCVISNCSTSYETIGLNDIEPVFAAGEALHERSAADRLIFTFVDGDGQDNDGDGLVDESGEAEGGQIVGKVENPDSDNHADDNGEVIRFDVANADQIKPFLGIKNDTAFSYLETGGPDHDTRVANLINYIRGVDSDGLIGAPRTRSRTLDGHVWKLGDIARSTPVTVAGGLESYDLIYNDESYLAYIRQVADREQVVYTGANDGMLHAFSHGRYDASSGFQQVDSTPIGEEIWAYIPQAVLPHLKWLADPDYGHTFYVDSKPKIFDARIFSNDSTHPEGWGTILLVGLGAGGKYIWAEGDFGSGSDVLRYFNPTYVCMDITDPRNPKLLWERSYENLGMTTSYPVVVHVGTAYDSNAGTWSKGKWYVAFGSGPKDNTGKTDYYGHSDQNGFIFIVDVKTGELSRGFDTGLANAVMSSPASLDKGSDSGTSPIKGLTYNVDAVYIGAANYTGSQWQGMMYKINTRFADTVPSDDPDNWTLYSLFESERPITAAPALSVDGLDNVWVFFGTGRFQEMADRVTTEQNYLIGIKDPYFNSQRADYYHNNGTAYPLSLTNLFYANPYEILSGPGTIHPLAGGLSRITDWNTLLSVVRNTEDQSAFKDYFDGWYRELDPKSDPGTPSERIISKPSILNGVVFTPVYIPDDDICGFGGYTDIYGVYYETGTPLWKHIFNTDTREEGDPDSVAYRLETGEVGPPPSALGVHIGKQSGASLFTQTGNGSVLKIDVAVPVIESNIKYWIEE